jgi:8-amino-7-oxononanoate synthase
MQQEPERRDNLWKNTRRWQAGLEELGFDTGESQTPVVPVIIGELEDTFLFWCKLFDAGVFTNPVVPPAVPDSQCRLRTSLMATHSFEQVDFCLEAIGRVGRELGVI